MQILKDANKLMFLNLQDSFRSLPPVDEVYPPLRRENFAHSPHIGAVSAVDASPFHRNLFLTAGADGVVQLVHMLERAPLRQWEPLASAPAAAADSSKQGSSKSSNFTNSTASISAVQFSPVRPTVFAAASSNGLLFLYDLRVNGVSPVRVVEAPAASPHVSVAESKGTAASRTASNRLDRTDPQTRSGLTGIAFSPRQRDLIAGCDWTGRVHVWKLGWRLSNRFRDEQALLNDIGNIAAGVGENSSNSDAAGSVIASAVDS